MRRKNTLRGSESDHSSYIKVYMSSAIDSLLDIQESLKSGTCAAAYEDIVSATGTIAMLQANARYINKDSQKAADHLRVTLSTYSHAFKKKCLR